MLCCKNSSIESWQPIPLVIQLVPEHFKSETWRSCPLVRVWSNKSTISPRARPPPVVNSIRIEIVSVFKVIPTCDPFRDCSTYVGELYHDSSEF